MGYFVVFTVFAILFIHNGGAIKCYSCKKVDNLDKCTQVVDCAANEHCHAKQYMDSLGTTFYDADCKPMSLCGTIETDEQSDSEEEMDFDLWTSCCKTDYCNGRFDINGALPDPATRVMECYKCAGIKDPADCTQKTRCDPGDVCLTHEKITTQGKVFDMGCLRRPICQGIGFHLGYKRHTKRFELCRGCCDRKDLCNNQFCSAKLGLTNMTALGTSVAPVGVVHSAATTYDPLNAFHLVMTPANLTGHLGSTVQFVCEFDHLLNESTKLSWFFKDKGGVLKKIYEGDTFPPSLDFYVKNLEMTDAGDYICEADLHGHKWTSTSTLTVATDPGHVTITHGPATLNLNTGDKAVFTCEFSADPTPTVQWEHLHNSPTPLIVAKGVAITGTQSTLTIDSVKDVDSGVYTCVVINSAGKKSALAVLNVA